MWTVLEEEGSDTYRGCHCRSLKSLSPSMVKALQVGVNDGV